MKEILWDGLVVSSRTKPARLLFPQGTDLLAVQERLSFRLLEGVARFRNALRGMWSRKPRWEKILRRMRGRAPESMSVLWVNDLGR